MQDIGFSRRRVLSAAAAGCLAAAIAYPTVPTAERIMAQRLTRLFGPADDIRRISAAISADFPGASAGDLLDGVLGDARSRAPALSDDALRAVVRRRIGEDFAAGRTGRVAGWILARSEIDLYRLAALATA